MAETKITLHPLSRDATAAWGEISKTQKFIKLNVKIPTRPVEPNKVRFVCMSDTHSLLRSINFDIPEGDVFLHAGDFTKCGHKDEVLQFNTWLENLPHKHKIVIGGNHELSFDQTFVERFKNSIRNTGRLPGEYTFLENYGDGVDSIRVSVETENIKQYLTNCTYLEDSGVEIYGIKIYGTPWQPRHANWGFNLDRGAQCLAKWDLIPENTDILITHTPPVGHGDLVCENIRAGCVDLLTTVQQRVKPKYHVFGHIHEGYGVSSDGSIIYINASTCDINYIPRNPPVVFDVPLPNGFTKN